MKRACAQLERAAVVIAMPQVPARLIWGAETSKHFTSDKPHKHVLIMNIHTRELKTILKKNTFEYKLLENLYIKKKGGPNPFFVSSRARACRPGKTLRIVKFVYIRLFLLHLCWLDVPLCVVMLSILVFCPASRNLRWWPAFWSEIKSLNRLSVEAGRARAQGLWMEFGAGEW